MKMTIGNLRDTEQGILNYMLVSSANFLKIKSKLSENDFTFIVHKLIFRYMLQLKKMLLSDNFHGVTDLNVLLEIFANLLHEKEEIKTTTTLNILSQPPSMYIDRDIEVLNAIYIEKEIAISNKITHRDGAIQTKEGMVSFYFINETLISIVTTNIFELPSELHNNFWDTIEAIELESENNKLAFKYHGDSGRSEDIESFYFMKDVAALKWFYNICAWADKYDLDKEDFPRDIHELQNLLELNISSKGIDELPKEIGKLTNLRILTMDDNNIKEFPQELYQLKDLGLLSFINNRVSYISQDIINLKGLVAFIACKNEITTLPINFYKLSNLEMLCLHDNGFNVVPKEIANFTSLKQLTLSNNEIKELPQSIARLEKLESLDIENTQIQEIPMGLLKLKNINALSVNDDVLPFLVKNIALIDVNTINLSASNFQESSKIIQNLNFNIGKGSWVEDRDKKDNGCVQLSKYKEEKEE